MRRLGRRVAAEVTGTDRAAEMAPKRSVACADTLNCGLDALGDRHPCAFAMRLRFASVASESSRRYELRGQRFILDLGRFCRVDVVHPAHAIYLLAEYVDP